MKRHEKIKEKKKYILLGIISILLLIVILIIVHGIRIMAAKNQYSHTVLVSLKEAEKVYKKQNIIRNKENYKNVEINYIYPEQKNKDIEKTIISQMKDRAYSTIEGMDKNKEISSRKKMILNYRGNNITDRIISFTVDQKIYSLSGSEFKLFKEIKEPQNIMDGKTGNKFQLKDLFKKDVDPMPVIKQKTKEEFMKIKEFNLDNIIEVIKFKYPEKIEGSGMKLTEKGLRVPVNTGDFGIENIDISLDRLVSIVNPEFLNQDIRDKIFENNLERERGEKRIAITFDDGPNQKTTTRLLDFMKEEEVKGTFFILGHSIKNNEKIVKRIVDEGHELGNHSWDHPNLLKVSNDELYNQILKTSYEIYKASGKFPETVRPPYGAINYRAAKEIGMPIAMWSVDSEDWMNKENSDKTFKNAISYTNPGDIILFHDIYDSSVDAIIKYIQKLKNEGYKFVTLSELFNYELRPEKAYHNIKNIRDLKEEK